MGVEWRKAEKKENLQRWQVSDVNIVGCSLPGDGKNLHHMGLCGGLLLQAGALGSEADQDQKTADVGLGLAYEKVVPCNATKSPAQIR